MPTNYYIILDAAKTHARIAEAKRFNPRHICLYSGEAEERLHSVAPWLFTFRLNSNFAEWYLANGGQQHWGIILESAADFKTVYLHLKKFLYVKTEAGKKLYFRFYDPRVLPTFLETGEPEQLTEFFGPINKFIVELKNGQIMEYQLSKPEFLEQPELLKQASDLFNQISAL